MKIFRLIILLPVLAQAQVIDYKKVIIPETIVAQVFEERLVQLAWNNNPSNKEVIQNVQLARREKKLAQFGWLDNIYAAGNINEFTINPNPEVNSVFFPRYNFGVRFSLGTFFLTPIQAKVANDKIVNSMFMVDQQKLQIRETILAHVERLKHFYKFIKLRDRIREDYLSMYKNAERQFSIGEITIEAYRAATLAYYKQVESVIEAEASYNEVEINIEAIVGIELKEVNGYSDFILKLDEEMKAY